MKKILYILLPLLAASFCMGSCIKSENEDGGTPTCVIASFSVGDIVSSYSTTISGKDTVVNRTIAGSTINFNIDQVNGRIESVDSLPYWADLSRIVPSISASGVVYCRQGGSSAEYQYYSGADSIDFTGEVDFLVVSTDGNYSKNYKAVINKSDYETDSLYWTQTASNLILDGNHRTLAKDGSLYLFADNNGQPTVTVSEATGTTLSWTAPQPLSVAVHYESVTLFKDRFYGIDEDGQLYVSDNGQLWNETSDTPLERLLASDNWRLYGFDGSAVVASADGVNWTTETAADAISLPQMPVSYAAYTSSTNANLQNVVMMGANGQTAYTPVWFKISASDTDANQHWNYINITADNAYPMPTMDHVQMVRYNGCLLAIGSGNDELTPYADIYVSDDNGITWHLPTAIYKLADELEGTTLPVSLTVCGKNLWLIRGDGTAWRGVIN